MFRHYDYYHDLLFSFNFDIITIIVIVVVIVIVNFFTIIRNTACPLQATSQVFALVPIGSQEHGRKRGHLMNVLPRYLFIYMPWSGLILAVWESVWRVGIIIHCICSVSLFLVYCYMSWHLYCKRQYQEPIWWAPVSTLLTYKAG